MVYDGDVLGEEMLVQSDILANLLAENLYALSMSLQQVLEMQRDLENIKTKSEWNITNTRETLYIIEQRLRKPDTMIGLAH